MAKKKLKTIIVKRARPTKFDLTFKKASENVKILMAIESLKQNSGWQFLVQVFEENIKHLTNQIIDKVDEYGKPIKEEEADTLRFKRKYLEELLEQPDKFIKELKRSDTEPPNHDPYA